MSEVKTVTHPDDLVQGQVYKLTCRSLQDDSMSVKVTGAFEKMSVGLLGLMLHVKLVEVIAGQAISKGKRRKIAWVYIRLIEVEEAI